MDGDVVLVFDVADDLFENILERDHALQFAILVDNEREVLALGEELVELVLDLRCLGHEPGLAQNGVEIDLRQVAAQRQAVVVAETVVRAFRGGVAAAEANVGVQEARLRTLEVGARPEDVAIARE
ncbi:MAG: hypothetical protein HC787_01830, partial [Nostocaceae cyanobacterium CSU_2_110]|nr:hypothetical protein [Nostocaceae cyanobacterium CSU_2_110]